MAVSLTRHVARLLRIIAAPISSAILCSLCATGCAVTTAAPERCTPNEGHCVGNTAVVCRWDELNPDPTWRSADCGVKTCVAAEGQAICAEPECFRAPVGMANVCVAGTLYRCEYGSWVDKVVCASADLCMQSPVFSDNAACVLSSTPDPLCAAGPDGRACDGQVRIGCAAGYRVYEFDCGGAGLCRTIPPGPGRPTPQAQCVLSAVPDPRCAEKVLATIEPFRYGCDGNVSFVCLGSSLIAARLQFGSDPTSGE
jgi:hypothetical protein